MPGKNSQRISTFLKTIGRNTLYLSFSFCAITPIQALTVEIYDQNGEPVNGAVVALKSTGSESTQVAAQTHTMDQVDKRFTPELLVIRKGDSVRFPNSDNVRHHVYSFSKANQFELPLYSGEPSGSVEFPTEGKVIMGCNIHDSMLGTIYVLDDDHMQISAAGKTTFELNNSQDYVVKVYHPRVKQEPAIQQTVSTEGTVKLILELIPEPDNENLSALELKFKRLRDQKK